jgi:hypothetical protein
LQFAHYQRFYYRVVHGLAWAVKITVTALLEGLMARVVLPFRAWPTVSPALTAKPDITVKAQAAVVLAALTVSDKDMVKVLELGKVSVPDMVQALASARDKASALQDLGKQDLARRATDKRALVRLDLVRLVTAREASVPAQQGLAEVLMDQQPLHHQDTAQEPLDRASRPKVSAEPMALADLAHRALQRSARAPLSERLHMAEMLSEPSLVMANM